MLLLVHLSIKLVGVICAAAHGCFVDALRIPTDIDERAGDRRGAQLRRGQRTELALEHADRCAQRGNDAIRNETLRSREWKAMPGQAACVAPVSCCRSRKRWILPLGVFGKLSTNAISRG